MNFVLPILFFFIFLWGIYKWNFFRLQGLSRTFLITAFIVKVFAGVVLTMIYTHHYKIRSEADTFRYFDDSYYLHKAASENPSFYLRMMLGTDDGEDLMPYLDAMNNWFPAERTTFYNDNRTVIRINAMIRWISSGNYYVHLLFFLFHGILWSYFYVQSVSSIFCWKESMARINSIFYTIITFWSSGILKEGPLLLVFGITLHILNTIFNRRARWSHFTVLAICILFLFHLKFYVGLLLVPAITGYLWIINNKGPHPIIKVILNFSGYFIVATIWHTLNWNWSLFTVLKWKRLDFLGLGQINECKKYYLHRCFRRPPHELFATFFFWTF